MRFNFKNADFVTCRVLRKTVINLKQVIPGMVVRVNGWTAKQLMGSAVPALELVGDGDPKEPDVPVQIEIIKGPDDIETRDPDVENRDPVVKPRPRSRKAS